jgi:uncharacterized protein (DUF302 family)
MMTHTLIVGALGLALIALAATVRELFHEVLGILRKAAEKKGFHVPSHRPHRSKAHRPWSKFDWMVVKMAAFIGIGFLTLRFLF